MSSRIPQPFIEDILERTDIVELIGSRITLKKSGSNYMACCPFHDEKTPSFSVHPNKQFYYCFGCGAGGNAISFLMDYERSDFRETIESLAHINGLEVPAESLESQQAHASRTSLYDILEEANCFYQNQLLYHNQRQQAINYLKNRGIDGKTTKLFGIGLAPDGWNNLQGQLATNQSRLQLLQEAGLSIEKDNNTGHYDRFRNRLMFPIRDSRGRTIGFGGRVFDTSKPKYLNSPETTAFHKQKELYGLFEAKNANRHINQLIVVEGYMDVVALAQFGIVNAVATLGTSVSHYHIEKIFRQCNKVIFCFDGDNAGRKAADRALETVIPFMEAGKHAGFLFLPEGEDPDSLVQAKGKVYFESLIDNCQSLSEYVFDKNAQGLDFNKADDKAQLISDMIPLIRQMPKGSFQELMLRELSTKVALPIDEIRLLELDKAGKSKKSKESGKEKTPPDKQVLPRKIPSSTAGPHTKHGSALLAIRLLLLNPLLSEEKHPLEELPAHDNATQLLRKVIDYVRKNTHTTSAALIGYWLAHDKTLIEQALSLKIPETDQNQLHKEFNDCLDHIIKQKQRINIDSLIEKTKLNPNITLNDMGSEERKKFLQLFDKNELK